MRVKRVEEAREGPGAWIAPSWDSDQLLEMDFALVQQMRSEHGMSPRSLSLRHVGKTASDASIVTFLLKLNRDDGKGWHHFGANSPLGSALQDTCGGSRLYLPATSFQDLHQLVAVQAWWKACNCVGSFLLAVEFSLLTVVLWIFLLTIGVFWKQLEFFTYNLSFFFYLTYSWRVPPTST